ncbi:hypothetical protein TWF481_005454 [Arthrobotrys musiformis]|uniref:Uncharacterized protein n=1 Tax=Arthrobotrys musiformis TaxID=47236 RepID=A0AAV9WJJ3_9PEZI
MRIPTLHILLPTLLTLPGTKAYSHLFWQTKPTSTAPSGQKIFQPPAPCAYIPAQSRGLTITQFGERNLLDDTKAYQINNEWLDPVRYIGFWHNVKKSCEGLPDVVVRFYGDRYTAQTIEFGNFGSYAGWIGEKGLELKYWGEIPFGDEYFGNQIEPGEIGVRNSAPPGRGAGSYEVEYNIISNGVEVKPTSAAWGIDNSKWQNTGTGVENREISVSLPKDRNAPITGQVGDREKEVGLGYVPETYRFTDPDAQDSTTPTVQLPSSNNNIRPQPPSANNNIHPLLQPQPAESADQLAHRIAQWATTQWPTQSQGDMVAFINHMNGINLNLLRLRQIDEMLENEITIAKKQQLIIREQMAKIQQNPLAGFNPPPQEQSRQQQEQQTIDQECICPTNQEINHYGLDRAGNPRFLPDIPPNSLTSPSQTTPTIPTTNDLNSRLTKSLWENLVDDQLTQQSEQAGTKKQKPRGPKEISPFSGKEYKEPLASAIRTVRGIYNTQQKTSKKTKAPKKAVSTDPCICPTTTAQQAQAAEQFENEPVTLPSVLQKAESNREERKRLSREARITQSRTKHLSEFQKSRGPNTESIIETEEDIVEITPSESNPIIQEEPTNPQTNLAIEEEPTIPQTNPPIEEEKQEPQPQLPVPPVLIEEEEGTQTIPQVLIEEEESHQLLPEVIIREDENYDPDLFIMDPSLYDIEIKEEDLTEEARREREAKARRKAEARAQNAVSNEGTLPRLEGSEYFEELAKDEFV